MSAPAEHLDSYAEEVADLASDLVQVNSVNPTVGEAVAASVAAKYLVEMGLTVEVDQFDGDRANLTACLPGAGRAAGLLLSGHLDTVPVPAPSKWKRDPWSGAVEGGMLHGRGSLDVKGGIAALCVAVGRVARSGAEFDGDLVVALTAGEETTSIGAHRMCARNSFGPLQGAIIAEPTNLDVGHAHRGALWVKVRARGRAAHGSQPHEGLNAITRLLEWLGDWSSIEGMVSGPTDSVLGSGSASLNQVSGGLAPNVVPDNAELVIDMRTIPGQDHDALLADLAAHVGTVEFEAIRNAPPLSTPAEHDFVTICHEETRKVVGDRVVRGLPYTTDAAIFAKELGVPAVVLGPGSEHLAHTDDEAISVAELAAAAAIYGSVIRRVFP